MATTDLSVRARAENVARASYGRLLALLAAPTGDITAAEDALGDAFVQALRRWPRAGIPDNPEAWLLTVARNRQADRFRSSARRRAASLDGLAEGWSTMDAEPIPDRRLALMFVSAHPAIDARLVGGVPRRSCLWRRVDRPFVGDGGHGESGCRHYFHADGREFSRRFAVESP